ncbi:LOW QUALITY PROTEIN: sialin-like [Haliotis rubra]|uniref:LOW QUALITY PROTEIN: sialin-like n=1 Tax=Haliotis rubra TaxID=36100 RepID=UPI001EE5BB1D|nr:LOW QUALITY PROTEIN: sialin-like [Haliotis rubra]
MFFLYATRVNMSVAIICMVRSGNGSLSLNQTRLGDDVSWPNQALPENHIEDDTCARQDTSISRTATREEFDWDKPTRSRVLAMYFYGYIIMQIPGGWLAGRYGGRRVWGLAFFLLGLFTILTPVAARTSLALVYVLRFLVGLAAGVTFPNMQSMWGRWAPPLERSKLITFCMAGPAMGTIAGFALSGYLCAYGFDNGWGSIFYVFGAGTLVWVVLWFLLTADSPRDSSRISNAELEYIETEIGYKTNVQNTSTPWRAIFTSAPVWAIVVTHVCHNWSNYTLLTGLPTFMKEVLNFDIKQNGSLSAVPYLCAAVTSIIAGHVADSLRSRVGLATVTVRKIMVVVAFSTIGSFLIGASFVTCEFRHIAVVLLCFAVGGTGVTRAGFPVNHVDIAPRHAGVLYGITNTVATVPGMVAPLVAGTLTPNKTAEEWQNVFYVCAAFSVMGSIMFLAFAKGEVQSWAREAGDRTAGEHSSTYRVIYSPKSQP